MLDPFVTLLVDVAIATGRDAARRGTGTTTVRGVVPTGVNSRQRMTRRRSAGLATCAALTGAAAVVVSHDFLEAASLDVDLLCQRSDGSFWRDPSQGCTGGEDPRCTDDIGCADSTMVSEGWRHACTWFFFDREIAPRGEEPFYEGPSPGRGCLGRE